MDELQLLAKLGEMLVEMMEHLNSQSYGHGASEYLMAAIEFVGWIQSFSDLLRAVWAPKGCHRFAPSMGVAKVSNDEEFAVFVAQFVAKLEAQRIMQSDASQVIRPLQESGASSWALLLAPQEELKASKTTEFNESVLLDGHLSVALG